MTPFSGFCKAFFKKEEIFLELMTYGRSSFDRQGAQASPPDKQALAGGSLNKRATGNMYWLCHDLMWTADTLLRQGPAEHVLFGFDQVIHHLTQVGLADTLVERDLQSLRVQIQGSKEISVSLRDEGANKLGSMIDTVGATLEAGQSGFQKPPYWNRLR